MDLTTNGVVITDAIKFVQNCKEKLINQSTSQKKEDDSSKESKEPDYNEDDKDTDLEEEQGEKETGEIIQTMNQVF
jgi:hypothetical protein